MSGWTPRRVYKDVTVSETDGRFGVYLDGRPVRTPAKAPLLLPTEPLARMIAAEWDAQAEHVRPETMPATRLANVAIDKIGATREAVIDAILEYGGADLLCYRATNEADLAARQAAAWDPLLAWLHDRFGVRLHTTAGVVHVAQSEGDLARLRRPVSGLTDLQLAAFHELVGLSGSLVLPLAFANGEIDAATAWTLSRIDEEWQIELWGRDPEAEKITQGKQEDFMLCAAFLQAAA